MNSEELEQSLRSEFENYIKAVVAEIRHETTEFQSKIEAEFESHKNRMDEAVKAFAGRFESDHQFDPGFMSSVSEHLRLARDEGAKITAEAAGGPLPGRSRTMGKRRRGAKTPVRGLARDDQHTRQPSWCRGWGPAGTGPETLRCVPRCQRANPTHAPGGRQEGEEPV